MRTRHPFPDVYECDLPPSVIVSPQLYADIAAEMRDVVRDFESGALGTPKQPPKLHPGANRRQRRAATAQFVGPAEFGPDLRRNLIEQRKRRALGTMDVDLRRLQRKAKRQ